MNDKNREAQLTAEFADLIQTLERSEAKPYAPALAQEEKMKLRRRLLVQAERPSLSWPAVGNLWRFAGTAVFLAVVIVIGAYFWGILSNPGQAGPGPITTSQPTGTAVIPSSSLESLRANIQGQLEAFDGLGSVFVMDLQTGEEMSINADMPMSGLSILKILIFLETYRVLDGPPDDYVRQLLEDTAIRSSNYSANLLLHVIAGETNAYKGADIITESAHRLGLVNTFMAVPYDAVEVSTRPNTYTTPANSQPDLPTRPDPAMQTTAKEMGMLLAMIYVCAEGGGDLLAVYPDTITRDECQAIIDLMERNEEGNLIRFGMPEGVPISHKHGWDLITHGDAGIVFSPGGDYVIVEYVTAPESDQLSYEIGFPILREISRATYSYFNPETTIEPTTAVTTPPPGGFQFGDELILTSTRIGFLPDGMTVTLQWFVNSPPEQDYIIFFHLLDAQGELAAQLNQVVVNPVRPSELFSSTWTAGERIRQSYSLNYPSSGAVNGLYNLVMGLYDPRTGERLPVTAVDESLLFDDGTAVFLGNFGFGSGPFDGTAPEITYLQVINTEGPGLTVRADPGKNGMPLAVAAEGLVVQVLNGPRDVDDNFWWHIRMPDGTEGWVVNDFVEPVAAPE